MSKRPVAFRWKNVADVWCLSKDEEHAAAMSGGDYQGLYVRDGSPAMYYTITHGDTHKPLGLGGKVDRARALAVIGARTRNDDGTPFSASEYYVTGWNGDGGDDDTIEFQVSADEFVACKGNIV